MRSVCRKVATIVCVAVFTTSALETEARADWHDTAVFVSFMSAFAGASLAPFGIWMTIEGAKNKNDLKKGFGVVAISIGSVALISGVIGMVTFIGTRFPNTIITTNTLTFERPPPAAFTPKMMPTLSAPPTGRGAVIGFSMSF